MKDFISTIGDIDYQKVTLDYGEKYRQVRLDRGNTAATVTKKLKHLKRLLSVSCYSQAVCHCEDKKLVQDRTEGPFSRQLQSRTICL